MARNTTKNFKAASRYMHATRFGFNGAPLVSPAPPYGQNPAGEIDQNIDHDFDNNKSLTWADTTDTISTQALKVNNFNRLEIDREVHLGARLPITWSMVANAGMLTQSFYIADGSYTVTGAEFTFGTAGTDAGGLTVTVTKDSNALLQAPGTGALINATGTSFNAQGTINTVQYATLAPVDGAGNIPQALKLVAGDRLSVVFTGVITSLANVVLTVYLAPGQMEAPAVYTMNANASLATQAFYLANRDQMITGVNIVWSAAATNAGTVTIGVTHETGTTAPGSGTAIFTAISAKTAASTTNSPTLTTTASALYMNAGDRLSVVFTGTLTALAGVVVVVYTQAMVRQGSSATVTGAAPGYIGQIEVTYEMAANGSIATQEFFIADRDYQVIDASLIWSTAGSGTGDLQIDKGTTAAGSGSTIATGTIAVTGTANTATVETLLVSRRRLLLSQGDRLCFVPGGTLGALAGVVAQVSLWPV